MLNKICFWSFFVKAETLDLRIPNFLTQGNMFLRANGNLCPQNNHLLRMVHIDPQNTHFCIRYLHRGCVPGGLGCVDVFCSATFSLRHCICVQNEGTCDIRTHCVDDIHVRGWRVSTWVAATIECGALK